MKKMNKKGFTLVEMLVVIAIIAILVSILIPTVLGATTKAKAATDAANLRSALAEFQIAYLTGDGNVANWTKATDGTFSKTLTTKSKLDTESTMFIWEANGTFNAGYGSSLNEAKGQDIAHYADKAGSAS